MGCMQAYAVLGPQERGTLVHLGAGRVAMLAAEGACYLESRGELAAHDGLVCMQLISLLVRRSAAPAMQSLSAPQQQHAQQGFGLSPLPAQM